ncbi:transporter substrate-binding domain-containing protein [Inquilinus sp. Marseille-Q2685]|uniref:transporter substrate-binding domain-containing protein n=1 Tax=Inquilinus sp. Marseille-Q2685 TaxID=2866581 RepID=UPI001CE402CC|nr:transporter substrate-binding domain-containing protein [Inquilinus sp. Marseille-Q2685]
MMKSWLSLAAAAALALAAGTASAETLRVGTEGAYPPYNATDASGKLVGFEIDLANELCKRTNMTCEIIQQDWDGMIPALLNKRYDAIMAGMSVTEERMKQIAFSKPYSTTPAWFVSAKDGVLKDAKTLADIQAALKGKSVGVQRSTIHQNFLEAKVPGADVKLYDTQDDLNLDLQNGRIDAGLADSLGWKDFLASDAGKGYSNFGPGLTGKDDPIFGLGVGIGLRKEDTALKEKLDKALDEVNADGTMTKLSVQWFGFDTSIK